MRQNQDTLGTRPKCIALVKASLAEGKSVVVDNTSRDAVTRQHYTVRESPAARASSRLSASLQSMRATFPDVVFRCFDFTSAGMDLARHNAYITRPAHHSTTDLVQTQMLSTFERGTSPSHGGLHVIQIEIRAAYPVGRYAFCLDSQAAI